MRRSVVKKRYPGLDFSEDVVLADKTVGNLLHHFYKGCARKKDLDSDGIEIIKCVRQRNANLRNKFSLNTFHYSFRATV